jgi:hypothetical protein
MPLLATALTAGKAAFSLIPKNKEARKKAAEKLKSGFQWAKKQAGKLASFKKTESGYTVTGKTFDFKAPTFGGQDEPQNDLMKYAPYVIGGILLLSMKR